MIQDVLIIKRQVEANHHSGNPTSMTIEEWKLIDEIACSTIRMHLAENVYFSMAIESSGEKILFEIDQDVVEGPTHRIELALPQTAEENEVPAESESEKGPLVELGNKAIKDKAELTRVKKV